MSTSDGHSPSRVPICVASSAPMTLWSPPRPLPMSCSRAPSTSRSGRDTRVVKALALRDGFDQMTVDRPDVDDVARRKVAHRSPLRKQPAPQARSVQRLDRRHGGRACGEQHQQVLQRLFRPGGAQFRRGLGEPAERGRRTAEGPWSPTPPRPAGSAPGRVPDAHLAPAPPRRRTRPHPRPVADVIGRRNAAKPRRGRAFAAVRNPAST